MDASSNREIKRYNKKEREIKVLFGLIEQHLDTGEPVGSNMLKSAGFEGISSATIRNYFSSLEKEGYLKQLHTSGGRIPTQKAYRAYAEAHYEATTLTAHDEAVLKRLQDSETKEIALFLQQSAEALSSLSNAAIFLSAPRFDHDFIADLKLVPIDYHRFLCVIITDFGVIQTELLNHDHKLSTFSLKRIEGYFHFRLTGRDKPENLTEEEEELAKAFYNEIMMRYIVGYSTFVDEEIYRTGFSKLLSYPDFRDAVILSNSLALFENAASMRKLLRDCSSHDCLKYWIGDDLDPFAIGKQQCAVAAIPYRINQKAVGAIGVLGPVRLPYKRVFSLLRAFSESISLALTRNIFKFKITFRQPDPGASYLQKEEHQLIGQSRLMLLEDKTGSADQ